MKHVKAALIKVFFITLIVSVVMNLFTNVNTADSIAASILITAILYAAGDLMILKKTTNSFAALIEAGMAFLLLWGYLIIDDYMNIMLWSFAAAVMIGVFEYFFHRWLLKTRMVVYERKGYYLK